MIFKTRNILPLFLGCMLMLASCKSSAGGSNSGNKTTAGIPSDFMLDIRHVGCRGGCPHYNISVDANGKAIYHGHHAVEMMGDYDKEIDKKTLKSMVRVVKESNFWDFEKEYGGGVADLPYIVTKITMDGRTHEVSDIRFAPKELKELEASLENLVGKEGWIKRK